MDDRALYRLALPDGPRLALGPPSAEPQCLLPPEMTLDGLLSGSADQFRRDLDQAPYLGAHGSCADPRFKRWQGTRTVAISRH